MAEPSVREKIEGPAAVRQILSAAERLADQVDLWFGDRKPAGIGSTYDRFRASLAHLDEVRRG